MCCLRNIAVSYYQESVTTGQKDRHTIRQTNRYTDRHKKAGTNYSYLLLCFTCDIKWGKIALCWNTEKTYTSMQICPDVIKHWPWKHHRWRRVGPWTSRILCSPLRPPPCTYCLVEKLSRWSCIHHHPQCSPSGTPHDAILKSTGNYIKIWTLNSSITMISLTRFQSLQWSSRGSLSKIFANLWLTVDGLIFVGYQLSWFFSEGRTNEFQ